MLLAQISDPHVTAPGAPAYGGRLDTGDSLARCVAEIAALEPRPELVLVTGDLVDRGSDEEYARLRPLLDALPAPYCLIPGNHDDRDALRRAFADHDYLRAHPRFVLYALQAGPLRIVGLDTVVPGAPHGALCAERLEWLDATLAERPAQPTVVLMHHPPFATGIARMDAMGLLEGGPGLAAVLARHPQVERLVCGHLHRPIDARFAGVAAGTCPSTGAQLAPDLRPGAPLRFLLEPPGYRLHLWVDERLVTHTVSVQAAAGFDDD